MAVRRNGTGALVRLLRVDRPVCAIPQLAIHLDREVNTAGLLVDAQHHLTPIWGIEPPAGATPGPATGTAGFVGFVAHELGVDADDVLGWDLMLHDLAPGAIVGRDDELIGSARLDNLASCWAAIEALAEVAPAAAEGAVPMVCLFDHEEVGSTSDRGAASSLLPTLLERSVLARGGDRQALHRALARSACLSADMAHATHPNYADRHDPEHRVALNGGPVLKSNANVRYATDAPGGALVALAAEKAEGAAAALRHAQRPAVRLDDRPPHRRAARHHHRRRRHAAARHALGPRVRRQPRSRPLPGADGGLPRPRLTRPSR